MTGEMGCRLQILNPWGQGQQRMREWLEKSGTLNSNSHSSFPLKAQGEPTYAPTIRCNPTPSGPADTWTGATRGEVSYAPVCEGD